MKLTVVPLRLRRTLALALTSAVLAWCSLPLPAATPTVIYSTQFEPAEGYNAALDLEDQLGWVGTGGGSAGDNGLTPNYFGGLGFPGFGQQGYIGSSPLDAGTDVLFVWQPLNVAPLASNKPIVKFSVAMMIVDSTNSLYDSFRWSVYTITGRELFTLAFNNADLHISYLLENSTNFVYTGRKFANSALHSLAVTMDFGSNTWSATLDNTLLVTNLPITTTNTPLTLGDIDAVWLYGDSFFPGDNFMLFDNYRITIESRPAPPRLTPVGFVNNQFLLNVTGDPGSRYALEVNTNLNNTLGWSPLQTNTAALDGTTLFLDSSSPGHPRRFYRARLTQ